MWAKLKDQTTPVPGTMMGATASQVKVSVIEAGKRAKSAAPKTAEFLVKLRAPISCGDTDALGSALSRQEEFILANGYDGVTGQMARLFKDDAQKITKIVLDPDVSAIQVAVTEDARIAGKPDFVVNLKTPVKCTALPAKKTFGIQPAIELDGTYDSYTRVAASDPEDESVQIVLRDGFVQPERKKPAAVRKPASAGHRSAHT